jgi:hypothetical protein
MVDRYSRLFDKFDWAKRRCDELEAAVEDFRRTQPYKIAHRRNDERGEITFYVEKVPELPVSLALLLGDVVHNLRSTLDHLAVALVSAAGGTPDKYVSFPVFDSLKAYNDLSRDRLKGVSQYCLQTIDNMQPYKQGFGHWAWQLHQLDIIDKHRLLLTVATMAVGRTMICACFKGVGDGRSPFDRRGCRAEAKGQQGLGLGSLFAQIALFAGHSHERRRPALPGERDRRVPEGARTGRPVTTQTPVKLGWPLVPSTQKLRSKWEFHIRKDGFGLGERNGMVVFAAPSLTLKPTNTNSSPILLSWG